MSNWVKATGGEQFPAWDREAEKEIEGIIVEKRENVGLNNSRLYVVEKKGGKKVTVWGTAMIDRCLQPLPVGTLIRLVYKGKTKGKKGNMFHDFDIDYDKDTVPTDIEEVARETFGQ